MKFFDDYGWVIIALAGLFIFGQLVRFMVRWFI